jgi:hypothetical protein
MTDSEIEAAWWRFLLRTGPRVDTAILHSIAGTLASDADADELLSLADDLMKIAEVVREEAGCEAVATPAQFRPNAVPENASFRLLWAAVGSQCQTACRHTTRRSAVLIAATAASS